MIVQCPSGFTIEVRKLKVAEANILADRQAQQRGATMDQLLSSVWVQTLDPGPYAFTGKPVWDDVLTGDRYYAQMQTRIATHGPEYEFRVPCSVCRSAVSQAINLSEQLQLKKLSDEDAETFRNGNRFEATAPDGKAIVFHLMTGRHEKRAQQVLKQMRTSRVTASLLSRIDEIEGVQNRGKYFDDLDFTAALELVQILDEHDCGLETDIEVECSECFAVNEVVLPLDQAGYWAPAVRTRRTGT